ncbi:MAG: hypothetical protein DRN03_05120 [Thermoplasmata archaeon]|nr:MAG: hypothetical protein DRN03_05120 [Thermoplasmata archaeon]
MTEAELVRSVFVPDSRIQGADIPVHIIWDEHVETTVQVLFPSKTVFPREVYNVKEDGVSYSNGSLLLSKFEVNGYVGLLLGTKMCDEPEVTCPIEIIIRALDGRSTTIRKNILLFRPEIVIKWPSKISIICKEGHVALENRIIIVNEGPGTAIVSLEADEDSDVIIKRPEEIEEFLERFREALNENLDELKRQFPQYTNTIDEFVSLVAYVIEYQEVFTEEYLSRVDKVLKELYSAFNDDEDFALSFADAMVSAYFSSLPFIALHFRALLEYLNSIIAHRVILSNATSLLVLRPGLNKLRGRLTITDLAHNRYRPVDFLVNIDVDVTDVTTDGRIEIPLYMLFSTSSRRG